MRIVSKQKDYYDGVMAHGMDLSLLYIRDAREEVVPTNITLGRPNAMPFSMRMHIVGFCGSVYPVIEIAPRGDSIYPRSRTVISDGGVIDRWSGDPRPEWMFHDFAHVDAYMRANLKDQELKQYTDGKVSRWDTANNAQQWIQFFDAAEKNKGYYAEVFFKARAPIFIVSDDHKIRKDPKDYWATQQGISYNPLLKPYAFAKLKDPFTAFQDIRMWLSNLAVPEKPIPQLSNEDMAASKGHGDKYSFRKPPSKR